jgi:2'-5' RNA ligase
MAGPDRSELVIVALPTEDDRVRKLSSEKEPHLTLLYLGKPDFDSFQIEHVIEYVEHASSMLTNFYLEVQKRGELGPNKADVLFFDKRWSKQIETFRTHLLQDPMISAAYHSAEQFPGWTPHLTLGYPETPAKKEEKDSSFFSVHFDRIAVWVGDSSGPEFELPLFNYDDMEVAMSQLQTSRHVVDDMLKHYGVKGMKWGVRRSDAELAKASGGPQPRASADAKAADSAQAKIDRGGTHSLSNQELQGLLTRMNLERQYHTMTAQHGTELDRGLQNVQKALKVGKTVEDVRRFMKTPTGQAVKTGVASAFAAAAGFATGGPAGAAAAGASVAVRRTANHYTNNPR